MVYIDEKLFVVEKNIIDPINNRFVLNKDIIINRTDIKFIEIFLFEIVIFDINQEI